MTAPTSQTPGRPPSRADLSAALAQGWREYRSMRTALALLLILGVASVFGSLFPQRPINPQRVAEYLADNPGIGPLLDRLGMFDVFGAPWYLAIAAALLGAVAACIVPRTRAFLRMLRARPPRASAQLDRYRNHAAVETAAPPGEALATARRVLRRRRYRLAERPGEVAAEKGYLREAGSILFHLSFLLLLAGLAYGKAYGFRGQMVIVEGQKRANALINYDAFNGGRWFDAGGLPPFTLELVDFRVSFHPDLTPREFTSDLVAVDSQGRERRQAVAPNHPLTVDGVQVFQSDYGYAPWIVVRDAEGKVLRDGPVETLRDRGTEISTGAVKLPELSPQVGLEVTLFTGLITAPDCPGGAPFCNDPRPINPVLVIWPYQGDLQADQAQSVFTLNLERLERVGNRPVVVPLGGSAELPGGLEVSFPRLPQYTVLTLARDPGVPFVAVAAALVLAGLIPSLYVTRRRVWARVTATPAGARVELAGLALQGKAGFVREFAAIAGELRGALPRPTLDDRAVPAPTRRK